jgi:hypothetical protein
MANKDKWDKDWAEAKRRCRLNMGDIRKAKELGLNPRSLIKNIPSPTQRWKSPVKVWISELYERQQQKIALRKSRKEASTEAQTPQNAAQPEGSSQQGGQRTVNYPVPLDRKSHGAPRPRAGEHETSPERPETDGPSACGSSSSASIFPLEIARWNRFLETIPLAPTEEETEFIMAMDENDRTDPTADEIAQQDRFLLRRQRGFRIAAAEVAESFEKFPWVRRVALVGSVAFPLQKEVPRFYRYRRARIKLWHECKNINLLVWIDQLGDLNELRRDKSRTVNLLSRAADCYVSVAHHQVDVRLLEHRTDRYLGRVCDYAVCPKGKPECLVENCGAHPFLQQIEGFRFNSSALDPQRMTILFNRAEPTAGPERDLRSTEAEWDTDGDDQIPF